MPNVQRRLHPFATPPPRCADGSGDECRPIDVIVGRRLLARRLELALSHEDLAAAVEVPPARIAAYERGEERVMPAYLIRFTDLLGVKLRFFFVGA
jgi:ribosome-binding protein aMBF1 (putative translation factor)